MSTDQAQDLDGLQVTERERWQDGPPHELFKQLRAQCPVHWTPRISEYPTEAGYWSVTTADDVYTVSRDWETYSSELGGITALTHSILPLELQQAMFIGMDPPKHDRLKALFQRGFTPKRIAEHEDQIREITRTVLDRLRVAERPDSSSTCPGTARPGRPSRRCRCVNARWSCCATTRTSSTPRSLTCSASALAPPGVSA